MSRIQFPADTPSLLLIMLCPNGSVTNPVPILQVLRTQFLQLEYEANQSVHLIPNRIEYVMIIF